MGVERPRVGADPKGTPRGFEYAEIERIEEPW
jgi:hypothetical protein